MNEQKQKILDKVRRLLALAQGNPNPHESAAAAARAQALMSQHAIDEATLDVDTDEDEVQAQWLGEQTTNLVHWRGGLSAAVARSNRCETAWGLNPKGRRQIMVFGSPDDIATVRYLYSALVRMCRESAKAAMQHGVISGRSEANAYRLGWVKAVASRLMEAAEQTREGAPGAALVKLDQRALRAKEALPDDRESARPARYSGERAFVEGMAAGLRTKLNHTAAMGAGATGDLSEGAEQLEGGQ